MSPPLKVYLAGPDVFRPDAEEHGLQLKAICREHGVEGVFPTDAEIDRTGREPFEVAKAIFEANIDLIHDCDAVIANMTPFRGPNMGVGTAFEIGYATALGKLIIGYTADNRDYIEKAAEFFSGDLREQNSEWRDPDSNLVENFGLQENLMVACAATEVVDDFEAAIRLLVLLRKETAHLF
jgi:nucleoside 2-deoxyribosyltransferase